jgi:pimeloyl-ACP methyl ester carboxylesterase/DNA-binding SARP family transcriptional activator
VSVAISLLGPFRVVVDGRSVADDSWNRRDAASLVKLLALRRGRQLHREQVMDLLWPDLAVTEATPRLHKAAHFARKAIGCNDAVVLRGELVSLFPDEAVFVDAAEFERVAASALAEGSAAAAEEVLDQHPGEPLPAEIYLDWAAEPRERLAAFRNQLLRQARRWRDLVLQDPTDEEAAVELMRELAQAGDRRGALREFESLDRAMRRELGVGPGPEATALRKALMSALRDAGTITPADEGRLEQQIRFCRTDDGVTLAYACSGSGPPLVKAANWLTHVDHDWHSAVWRHWLVELSRGHRLIRYDERGCGLSDWNIKPPTFESWVQDLETVVDAAGLDRFPLLGISQGGPVAVAYALRHPERVTQLVLYGTYARGRRVRAASDEARREQQLELELIRLGWGINEPVFRQVFTSQFMPEGSRELWDDFNELQRLTTSAENASRVLETAGDIDVMELAPQVRVPTLVLHPRDDQSTPMRQGRLMASLIPGSRFVALESRNHVLLADEPAWPVFLSEVEAFLAE